MNITQLQNNATNQILLANYIRDNEYLLPETFSKYVDLNEHSKKLLTLGVCLVIFEEMQIKGLAAGYINDFENKQAFLQLLLVEKNSQNKHYGTLLLKSFLDKSLKILGKESLVYLNVDISNIKAKKLYEKIGFEESKKKHLRPNKKIMEYKFEKNEVFLNTKQVQKRLLEMVKSIVGIFDKYEIPYQIAFGTLLGAVRHKGFIPWDDDFDLFLFEDSYDKAMQVLKRELPSDLFLEYKDTEPFYFHDWAHVKDIYTECECVHFPQDSFYEHKGINIDLYKMKKLPLCEFADYRYSKGVEYINRRKELNIITEEDYKNKLEIFKKRYEKEKLYDSEELIFCYSLDNGIQRVNNILPLRQYAFEDVLLWGPNNADEVLKNEYGDYMKLPPTEERIPHYSYVKLIRNN